MLYLGGPLNFFSLDIMDYASTSHSKLLFYSYFYSTPMTHCLKSLGAKMFVYIEHDLM